MTTHSPRTPSHRQAPVPRLVLPSEYAGTLSGGSSLVEKPSAVPEANHTLGNIKHCCVIARTFPATRENDLSPGGAGGSRVDGVGRELSF